MAEEREVRFAETLVLMNQHVQSPGDEVLQFSNSDDIFIMVAGKPGNGKTTALNNIFDLNLAARISICSVTTMITRKRVTKNGVDLIVIDTPGLGALDIDQEVITAAMVEALDGVDYTLLYCLSVGPGNRLTEMDKTIIHNLHLTLGKEVWEKCVVLFTFSDTARREGFNSGNLVSDYKEYTKGVAAEFYKVLQTCSSDVPVVKSIFEYEGNADIFKRAEEKKTIIAIPVGKNVDRAQEPDILPDIIEPTDDWTDLVFMEIMRKTKPIKRKSFVIFKYGAAFFSSLFTGAATGAIVGGGAGVVTGVVAGPVGVVVAGAAGAAIGAGVGVAASLTIASIVGAIKFRKKSKAVKQLLPKRTS